MQFKIYVAPGCVGGARAHRLASYLHRLCGRDEIVKIIDTTTLDSDLPADLFAVPSWYADGVLFSVGNPSEDQLRAAVEARFCPHPAPLKNSPE